MAHSTQHVSGISLEICHVRRPQNSRVEYLLPYMACTPACMCMYTRIWHAALKRVPWAGVRPRAGMPPRRPSLGLRRHKPCGSHESQLQLQPQPQVAVGRIRQCSARACVCACACACAHMCVRRRRSGSNWRRMVFLSSV